VPSVACRCHTGYVVYALEARIINKINFPVTPAGTGKRRGLLSWSGEDCLSPTVASVGASSEIVAFSCGAASLARWQARKETMSGTQESKPWLFTAWRSRHELFDSFWRSKKRAVGSSSQKNEHLVLGATRTCDLAIY
jgi:hypothetical protein